MVSTEGHPTSCDIADLLPFVLSRNHKLRRLKGKEFEGPRKRNRLSKLHLLESEVPCKIRIRVVYFIKHAKTDEAHNLGLGSCRK